MDIEQRVDKLEQAVLVIQKRNKRVEVDKAWETSWRRKLVVLILTYLIVVIFMYFSSIERPFMSAVVPSGAFLLSTLSLSFIKKNWVKNKYE